MICNVNHPMHRGVKCGKKRGHKGYHSHTPVDVWDEPENVTYHWAKGRGRTRTTGKARWTFS